MTQDEWNSAEEYLEGYMLDLTYEIVTQKRKLKDLINSDEEVILSYDPFLVGEIDQVWLIEDLIDWYVGEEEYEKCAELLKLKIKVEKGIVDLSNIIYLRDEDFITAQEDNAIKELLRNLLDNNYNKN
tara:strand:+ start:324 stop:707 length:384 start_codon:yes stop_codon:yes gene_type:complete